MCISSSSVAANPYRVSVWSLMKFNFDLLNTFAWTKIKQEHKIILLDICGYFPTVITGLEIATNTVAFATKFLPLRLEYLEKSQICDLLSPSPFRNKRVSSFQFAATFAKINK